MSIFYINSPIPGNGFDPNISDKGIKNGDAKGHKLEAKITEIITNSPMTFNYEIQVKKSGVDYLWRAHATGKIRSDSKKKITHHKKHRKHHHHKGKKRDVKIDALLNSAQGLGRNGASPSITSSGIAYGFTQKLILGSSIKKTTKKHRTRAALRTQEHLINAGSSVHEQINDFCSFLTNHPNVPPLLKKKIANELEHTSLSVERHIPFASTFQEPWGTKQIQKLARLQMGDAMWYDASTHDHTMMMRILKLSNSDYEITFANTGEGITSNPFFHPIKRDGNKLLYATVFSFKASMQDFNNCKFFDCLARAADEGKLSSEVRDSLVSLNLMDQHEKLTPLKAVYLTLHHLLNSSGSQIQHKDSYYSIPQYGASCIPSSIWAILSTISEGDIKLNIPSLKSYMSISALKTQYDAIIDGSDFSPTSLIMFLDLIQNVIKENRERQLNTGDLEEMQERIKKIGAFETVSVPIRTKEAASFGNDIVIRRPSIKASKGDRILEADMRYRQLAKNGSVKKIKNTASEGKRPQAENLCGMAYFLVDAIARGNSEDAASYLKFIQVSLKQIGPLINDFLGVAQSKDKAENALQKDMHELNGKKLQILNGSGDEEELDKIDQLLLDRRTKYNSEVDKLLKDYQTKKEQILHYIYSEEDSATYKEIISVLISAAYQIHRFDRTREALAQNAYLCFLAGLFLEVIEKNLKDTKWARELLDDERIKSIREAFWNLDVQAYYSEGENGWIDGINLLLQMAKPKTSS